MSGKKHVDVITFIRLKIIDYYENYLSLTLNVEYDRMFCKNEKPWSCTKIRATEPAVKWRIIDGHGSDSWKIGLGEPEKFRGINNNRSDKATINRSG